MSAFVGIKKRVQWKQKINFSVLLFLTLSLMQQPTVKAPEDDPPAPFIFNAPKGGAHEPIGGAPASFKFSASTEDSKKTPPSPFQFPAKPKGGAFSKFGASVPSFGDAHLLSGGPSSKFGDSVVSLYDPPASFNFNAKPKGGAHEPIGGAHSSFQFSASKEDSKQTPPSPFQFPAKPEGGAFSKFGASVPTFGDAHFLSGKKFGDAHLLSGSSSKFKIPDASIPYAHLLSPNALELVKDTYGTGKSADQASCEAILKLSWAANLRKCETDFTSGISFASRHSRCKVFFLPNKILINTLAGYDAVPMKNFLKYKVTTQQQLIIVSVLGVDLGFSFHCNKDHHECKVAMTGLFIPKNSEEEVKTDSCTKLWIKWEIENSNGRYFFVNPDNPPQLRFNSDRSSMIFDPVLAVNSMSDMMRSETSWQLKTMRYDEIIHTSRIKTTDGREFPAGFAVNDYVLIDYPEAIADFFEATNINADFYYIPKGFAKAVPRTQQSKDSTPLKAMSSQNLSTQKAMSSQDLFAQKYRSSQNLSSLKAKSSHDLLAQTDKESHELPAQTDKGSQQRPSFVKAKGSQQHPSFVKATSSQDLSAEKEKKPKKKSFISRFFRSPKSSKQLKSHLSAPNLLQEIEEE